MSKWATKLRQHRDDFTGWNFINSTGWVEQHYAPQNLMRDYMSSLSGMGATLLMDPSVAKYC